MCPHHPLRVLHIITRLDRGGSSENTLLTVAGLDKARYAVSLASGPSSEDAGPTAARAQNDGVIFLQVPHLCRAIRPLDDMLAMVELYRLVRRGNYDVVHTHTSKAGILGRIVARLAGVSIVVHTPHGHVFHGYYGKHVSRLFVRIERWTAGFTDRIVTLTARGARDHVAYGVAAADRFSVIHSGVEFSALEKSMGASNRSDAGLGIECRDFVFGTVGRLEPIKGHSILFEAFARVSKDLPSAKLLVIGDGELREDLIELACKLNISSTVIFAGWRTDVGELLRKMDVFVLSSHNEGMGKALVEAMYVGLPSIASNVGGIPEVLEDNQHGVLVPPGSSESLACAMMALARNSSERRRLGMSAAEQARRFSDVEMVAKIQGLYATLAGERLEQ
jgi:glycosyltransferase involved in cell wall biosynthesis